MIWANVARPRILLVAVGQTVHKPILQQPFEVAVNDALNGIPELMASELQDAIDYQARQASRR